MVSVLFVDDTEVGLRALRDTFAIGAAELGHGIRTGRRRCAVHDGRAPG